jgi:hypothetical protein
MVYPACSIIAACWVPLGILGLFDSFLVLNLPQGPICPTQATLRRQTWHKCMILGLAYYQGKDIVLKFFIEYK